MSLAELRKMGCYMDGWSCLGSPPPHPLLVPKADICSFVPFHNTDKAWLTRILFLETTAAIPGMVAGAVRHLHSLRLMRRDGGWIHTLLEEAENEVRPDRPRSPSVG